MSEPKFKFGDVVHHPNPCPSGECLWTTLGTADEEVYLVLGDTANDATGSTRALVLKNPRGEHVVGSYNTLYARHYALHPDFTPTKGESS